MSRDDGFPIADIDVGILRDVKIRRLRQHVPGDEAATTLLYLAVVLSSWEEGYRLSVDESDSPTPATDERIAALKATGLLDENGKVPAAAWESWFRPAWTRRDKKRAGGAEGNRRRWHPDKPQSDSDSLPDSDPESPSVPSVNPTGPSVTARDERPLDENDRRTCPGCGDLVLEGDPNTVVVNRRGDLGHLECPALAVVAT